MDKNGRTKIAVFDIDGTIFRKNLHFELINELAWIGAFPAGVRKRLTEIYTDWLEHEGTYEDYRRALVALYAEHIRGVSEEKAREASRIVVPFQMKRTYIFAEELIRKFRAEGYHIIAVSGSPIEIVEEYNRDYLKFDFVFGSVYEKDDNGLYTGETVFEPSKAKGEVLKTYLSEHGLDLDESYGIGDTESDISILEIVENPIAFNPNQNLKKVAEKEGWRIVVEKKDVIYEIADSRR
ncbi:MAG: HAD-IB family hydrolase [Candidatus Moranbacteria bacterium]|nr:HAD-IB family hydrolase [Candidatus Moranbacteria bacterium]